VNRKIAALLVLVVVTTTGVVTVLTFNPYGTEFHLEERFPSGSDIDTEYVYVSLDDLRDCNLTISFVNDSSLIYSFDIQLYEPTFRSSAFGLIRKSYTTYGYVGVGLDAYVRMRSVNVVLGTAKPYDLGVWDGTNLNSTVTYSNSAVLGKDFTYRATGRLTFFFFENVTFTDAGLLVLIGISSLYHPDVANIYVDLPSGLNGVFGYDLDPDAYIMHDAGWYNRVDGTYSTTLDNPEPLLSIGVGSPAIAAYLYS